MNVKELNKSAEISRRLNVLVVEDCADMARVITGILKVKGCNTIVSSNCEEAFKIIQTDMPDFVSCDIRLSGKFTGLDLARMVRNDNRCAHLFLIAISGFDSEKERAMAISAGFDLFFSKPVKFTDLTRAIEIYSEQGRN
jgi:CheY-like chemotaxis protein